MTNTELDPSVETKPSDTDASSSSLKETLAQAQRAFKAGDYLTVRALTSSLVDCSDVEVASAAQQLKRRTAVDPVHLGVLLACLVLWGTIAYLYLFP